MLARSLLLFIGLGLCAGLLGQAPTDSVAITPAPDSNTVVEVPEKPAGPSPAELLAAHRRTAIAKLVDGPRAPLDSQAIFGVRYFPLDTALSFSALFRAPSDTGLVNFPTSDGRARAYRPYGQLIFFYAAMAHQLTVYEMPGMSAHPVYGDHLFLPFFDESNGATTYGGGRYLDMSRAALATGDYRLDFNRAYNPWCAYADGYSCPVPPADNALSFAVTAGEAAFEPPALPDTEEGL